jgi:hypothetical protein
MCTFDKCDDVDTVNGGDCLSPVSRTSFSCEGSRGSFVVEALKRLYVTPGTASMSSAVQMDAERILMSFSRYECRMASDTAFIDGKQKLPKEWGEEFQVLVF